LILQTKDNNLIDGEEWILFLEKENLQIAKIIKWKSGNKTKLRHYLPSAHFSCFCKHLWCNENDMFLRGCHGKVLGMTLATLFGWFESFQFFFFHICQKGVPKVCQVNTPRRITQNEENLIKIFLNKLIALISQHLRLFYDFSGNFFNGPHNMVVYSFLLRNSIKHWLILLKQRCSCNFIHAVNGNHSLPLNK
jgi:hypothetical protein